MKDNSLAIEVFIDNRYPEHARDHIIESGRRDLLYKLSDSIMDGKYYCICFRRETRREQFGIREQMRFDVSVVNEIRHSMYMSDDLSNYHVVRTSIDEAKYRMMLWVRQVKNVILSSIGKGRKR